jgi:1-acyl-sn-glycerol-3-phosphate acyltransferase
MHRLIWTVWGVAQLLIFRCRTTNRQAYPKDGPVFLLPNHSSSFDPFWVAWPHWRPHKYMAANSLLQLPVLGWLLSSLGAFPKVKFVKDKAAMSLMESFIDRGFAVVIFPEGDRSWDGRPAPVLPGIGRMLKRYRVPVVFARMESAALCHPRWAKYPRMVPLTITYSDPHSWSEDATPEQITADVARNIAVVPTRDRSRWAWGWRMAWGLESYLWACPECYAVDALRLVPEDGNAVCCSACQRRWTVDVDMILHGQGAAGSWPLHEAMERLGAHFGSPPVLNTERYRRDGVVMAESPGTLMELKGKAVVEELRGMLRLRHDRLAVLDDTGRELWGRDLAAIDAITVEVKAQVFVRAEGRTWKLRVEGLGGVRWGLICSAWHRHVKPMS